MKKGSGFEKFFKGKEKTGAKKKEAIRQEKRQVRKQREDEIADHKRQKRAQTKTAYSPQQPPKYNLDPPGTRFQKKSEGFQKKGDGFQKRNDGFQKKADSFQKNSDGFQKRTDDRKPPFVVRKKEDGARPAAPQHKANKDPNRKWDKPTEPKREFKFEKKPPTGAKSFGAKKPSGFNQRDNRDQRDQRPNRDERNERGQRPQRSERPPMAIQKAQPAPPPAKGIIAKPQGNRLQTPVPNGQVEPMPLNKYIAHSGTCSRRDAVDLIKAGKVKVNGELILEPGHKVMLSDDVKVAGKRLNPVKDFIYILLNKPKDYITTTDDPQQRKTVFDLLKGAPENRIYPVGRLDRNTSGVLLLTNDGDLSQRLTHPSNEIKKVYAVTLDKPLTRHHFEDILKGVMLEDGVANVDTLAYSDTQDPTQIGIELHSGRNRIVRRIFEQLGYDVKGLDRVVFAGLTKKNVNRGKWRFLNEKEVRDLKFFKKGRS